LPTPLKVRGRVFSGEGKGAYFVKLPWAMRQFEEKLGFIPYAGTLNLALPRESEASKILKEHPGIIITPAEGFYPGRCFRVVISGSLQGAIVMPETPNYPENVLEVIAPVNLREKLSLRDGDEVEIIVLLE
jgi:riboflavin kinase